MYNLNVVNMLYWTLKGQYQSIMTITFKCAYNFGTVILTFKSINTTSVDTYETLLIGFVQCHIT